MESKVRSFIKSVTWRFLALLNGFVVTYVFIGNIKDSFLISFVANFFGFILYYTHERVWNKIGWKKI